MPERLSKLKPAAWRVECPPRFPYDFAVFPGCDEAETMAVIYNDGREEGDETEYEPEALYAAGDVDKLVAELTRMKKTEVTKQE